MDRPTTRYAKVGDAYIGYQVLGDGPIDLVYNAGWYSHLEAQWDERRLARFLNRLASFSRLIMFDRRGQGISDPIDLDNLTIEQWIEDTRAVMTAVGSERAVLVGTTESGPIGMIHAATHPGQVAAIILSNTSACFGRRDDYPWGMPDDVGKAVASNMRQVLVDFTQAHPGTLNSISPDLARTQCARQTPSGSPDMPRVPA